MIVSMQNNGGSITGIRMRLSDVRRHFPSDLKAVDLELDHLRIRCDLDASFWLDRPQISDPRLCVWLEEKLFWCKISTQPVLQMVRAGDSYRLQLDSERGLNEAGLKLLRLAARSLAKLPGTRSGSESSPGFLTQI